MDKYEKFKNILKESNTVVFFTGAGISTPSNIPDFRSANGLYNEKGYNISPEEIISHHFFLEYTKDFYNFYLDKMVYLSAKPNAAHYFISSLEKENKNVYVVTQNIDNLHQKSGSNKVIELHGNVFRNYCMKCHHFFTAKEVKELAIPVPFCPYCGGLIKPDVVLYEEPLDNETINKAIEVISTCDTLVVIGTSLIVYPAASFVRYFRGKHLILINKTPTSYDKNAEIVFNEDVISVFKKLNY